MADTSVKARELIYNALAAATDLTDIVGSRIYAGSAPQSASYPYVVVGDRSTDKRFNPKDATIQSHRMRIYAYSREISPLQIEEIKGAIFDALEKVNFSVSGASFVDCFQDGLDDVAILEDGRTYRALLEFLITLQ